MVWKFMLPDEFDIEFSWREAAGRFQLYSIHVICISGTTIAPMQ